MKKLLLFSFICLAGCYQSQKIEPIQTKTAENIMDDIYLQVAMDAEKEMGIVLKSGDPMAIYVQAGMCAAAWLQAKNEEKYLLWKEQEQKWAKVLGLP